jgi:Disulphide bond corrector protein DsbC
MMYGMAFPGDYLLAPNGIVRDRLFLPSYEHRPSATALVLRDADHGGGAMNSVEIDAGVFNATVTLSTDRAFPGQELATALRIRLNPGWHIYGTLLPGNYRPTELIFDGPIVGEQSIELPAAKPMLLKALGETLPVYEGEVRASGRLGVKWSPPMPAKFMESFGKMIAPGPYKIAGTLRFQACSDAVCEPPQAIRFELPLQLEAGVPPAPKKPA